MFKHPVAPKPFQLSALCFGLSACLAVLACNPTGAPTGTGSSAQSTIITQTLTPICADTLKGQKIIPEQAVNLGITETAVCECGIRRVEAKVTANPAILIDILNDKDKQISTLVELGQECVTELLQKALQKATGVSVPSPSPGSGSGTPTPSATPSGAY